MTLFRNRIAVVLWIFMAIWMTFLILMTYLVVRDGPPGGHSWATMSAILFLFWSVGLAVTAWAGTHPSPHPASVPRGLAGP